MGLREAGPTTLPVPASLPPLQDETPAGGQALLSRPGKNRRYNNLEDWGSCLIHPGPNTDTKSHTLTSPKAVPTSSERAPGKPPQFRFSSSNQS